jgi:excisionase family DNA binding protein
MARKQSGKPTGKPDFLTVREVTAKLRMSRSAVYLALLRGDIPSVRIGRTYRIPAAWLELEAGREQV